MPQPVRRALWRRRTTSRLPKSRDVRVFLRYAPGLGGKDWGQDPFVVLADCGWPKGVGSINGYCPQFSHQFSHRPFKKRLPMNTNRHQSEDRGPIRVHSCSFVFIRVHSWFKIAFTAFRPNRATKYGTKVTQPAPQPSRPHARHSSAHSTTIIVPSRKTCTLSNERPSLNGPPDSSKGES